MFHVLFLLLTHYLFLAIIVLIWFFSSKSNFMGKIIQPSSYDKKNITKVYQKYVLCKQHKCLFVSNILIYPLSYIEPIIIYILYITKETYFIINSKLYNRITCVCVFNNNLSYKEYSMQRYNCKSSVPTPKS